MIRSSKMFTRNKLSTGIALLTGSLVLSPVVAAQETEEKTDELKIEKILVTAQKRVQSLQDVPVTITTVGEEELLNAGVNSIHDIKTLVPAINVLSANNPAMTSITIRGAGTGASDPTIQPSVGVVIDGVFMPRSVFGIEDLVDVNRIEVLLGPQGTLYGKNTNSGVISVLTKGAPDEFELQSELTLGTNNQQDLKLSLGYALTDDLSFRLGAISRTRDGFIDNIATSDTVGDVDRQSFRGQIFWDITDDFNMRAIAYSSESTGGSSVSEYSLTDGTLYTSTLIPAYAAAVGSSVEQLVDGDVTNRKVSVNEQNVGMPLNPNLKASGGSIELNYDIGSYSFTSISALQDWSQTDFYADLDGTALEIANTVDNMAEDSFSQELRITSSGGDNFDWLAGLFYFESNLTRGSKEDTYADFNFGLPGVPFAALAAITPNLINPGDNMIWFNEYDTQSLAVFGQGNWYISDATTITLGLRYGEEEKDFSMMSEAYDGAGNEFTVANVLTGTYQGGGFVPFLSGGVAEALPVLGALGAGADPATLNMDAGGVAREGNRKDDDLTGMVSISHKVDDNMYFATISTGAKSGGFNGSFGVFTAEQREFDQETTINYEVGAKLDLLDGRMRLNTSYFHTVYSDFQASTFDPDLNAFNVSNAGKQTTKGVDLDLTYLISETLTVNAKVEYLDAKYNDFEGANCHVSAENVDFVPGTSICDLSGHTLAFAPEWAGSISLDYITELAGGELYGNLNHSFKSDYLADPTRASYAKEDLSMWNGRIGWRSDNWDISVWGKNLTDEFYAQTHTTNIIAGMVGSKQYDHRKFLNDPRTVGVTIRYNFY